MYKGIQLNGSDCKLTTTRGQNTYEYNDLILYDDVLGDPQCYFSRADGGSNYGILGDNSALETSVYVYYVGRETYVAFTDYLEASVPSDYYENVKTRNFTLTQRS